MVSIYVYSGVQRDIELVSEVLTGIRSYCSTMSAGRLVGGLEHGRFVQRCAFLLKKHHALAVFVIAPSLSLSIDAMGNRRIPENEDVQLLMNGHAFMVYFHTARDVRHVTIRSGPFATTGRIVGTGPLHGERSFIPVL